MEVSEALRSAASAHLCPSFHHSRDPRLQKLSARWMASECQLVPTARRAEEEVAAAAVHGVRGRRGPAPRRHAHLGHVHRHGCSEFSGMAFPLHLQTEPR